MGCGDSKQRKSESESFRRSVTTPHQNTEIVDSVNKYDEQFIQILLRDLEETPEIFVVNCMLMCVQFFENYQKDIMKLSHTTTSKMEKELNKSLMKNETMECTCPDIVFDKVNKNLRFRPLHGPRSQNSIPLAPKRLYVVNDIIEVVNSQEVPDYITIDKPAYRAIIEESPRKGFVRMRNIVRNKSPSPRPQPKTLDANFTDTTSIAEPQPCCSKDSDTEIYNYTTITDLKTPKPLEIMRNPERRDTLPDTCFATRKVKKSVTEMAIEFDEDDELTEEDFFEEITYVDSKGFMNYFKNALFPNTLGRALGFDELEIQQANAIPGKIFCNLADDDDRSIPCEVIPSVAIPWPAEMTFEFVMREERPTITDIRTGLRYRWPTDEMIKELSTLSCVLVPRGFLKKKGRNLDDNIEWEIAFPKAERHIETRMSHAQMRCFLFLLTVHRTYIEPYTAQHGLLVEHIRCHMYWECENNYRDWPEHRLASKLIKVMTNLRSRLAKGVLPDYFIKQKNLFENIPRHYLEFANKVLHDITEMPTMHFIKALRCIRYTSGKFYSPLNFDELYKILTQNQTLRIINPQLSNQFSPNIQQIRYQDADTRWKHMKQLKAKEKILKEKAEKQIQANNKRRESEDSINLDWYCEKKFDRVKIKMLLHLFINNYIDIAKDSSRISTKDQTLFYLKQAWYLTKLLEHTQFGVFKPEIRELQEIIAKEEEACKRMAVKELSDVPPTTPVRNSVQFDFTPSQQLRNNVVNLNSLHSSFNNNSNVPSSPVKLRLRKVESFRTERNKLSDNFKSEGRKSVTFADIHR